MATVCAAISLAGCLAGEQETNEAEIFTTPPRDVCDPDAPIPEGSWWDPYPITCLPRTESLWDVVGVVEAFQAQTPSWAFDWIRNATREQLLGDVSVSFVQEVADAVGAEPRNTAVHITTGIVEVPYETFIQIIPMENWGIELASRLGGEVLVYDVDDQGRATRQLERMVLSPFTVPLWTGLADNDMTKVEIIEHGVDGARVVWRVIYSDNGATEMDVGSVEFRRYDLDSTQVTFHSAHRLNALGAVHVPSDVLAPVLELTFRGLVDHYRSLAESSLY